MKTTWHVAVVDDEETVRKAVERLLRSVGMAAEMYGSGAALLDTCALAKIDCVVLDLHMADMDGLEVQSQLRRVRANLPIIIMTGHDSADTRARVLASGAADYLLKPVDDHVLFDAIRNAVLSHTTCEIGGDF